MNISDLYRATGGVLGPGAATPAEGKPSARGDGAAKGPSDFGKVLGQSLLNFSQHAETRIRSREIPWDPGLEKRVSEGIDAAHSKGSREALILADNVAVIANVKSRTVITAMDRSQLKEKIFTNIDSAVLV